MKIDRRAAFAAAIILAGMAGPVLASPAVVIAETAVHEGPGTSYAPVWSAGAGTHVNVRQCTDELWCLIERRGKQGWLPAGNLDLYPGVDHGDGDSASSGGGGSKGGFSRQSPLEKSDDDGKGRFAAVPKPGTGSGGSGTAAAATESANLAGAVDIGDTLGENTNQAHSTGPTFSTISGDGGITTIGDAVVAASCPRCR